MHAGMGAAHRRSRAADGQGRLFRAFGWLNISGRALGPDDTLGAHLMIQLLRLLVAAFSLAYTAGCSRQPTDEPAAGGATRQAARESVSLPAPLPREDITIGDRARWFERLGR